MRDLTGNLAGVQPNNSAPSLGIIVIALPEMRFSSVARLALACYVLLSCEGPAHFSLHYDFSSRKLLDMHVGACNNVISSMCH